MGKFYLGHVSYNGSNYYGWQKQKDLPTIQETIFDTLRGIYPLGRIDVKATSRTDRGVHAFSQVVKFLAPRREDPKEVLSKLNEALPHDIVFNDLERINKSFKVTYLSLYKEYLYFFTLKESCSFPFVGHFEGSEKFDFERLKLATELFVGRKNFRHFQYRSDSKGGFEREILETNIVSASDLFPECFRDSDEVYCFHVKGRGFLKQMVRMMMGGLVKVAAGEVSLEEVEQALTGVEIPHSPCFIVPPQGLFLLHIEFPAVMVSDVLRKVEDGRNFLKNDPTLSLWREGKEDHSFPILIKKLTD